MTFFKPKYPVRYLTLYGTILLVILSITGGLYAYWVWNAPYRTVAQFIRAAEQDDEATLFRLSVPEERAATNLTPQATGYALRDAFRGLPPRKAIKVELKPGWQNEFWSRQREYQCLVWWGDKKTGRPFPGAFSPTMQMYSVVTLKYTGEGWRVFTTGFLNSNYMFRWGRPGYFDRYEQMLKQTGMTGRLDASNCLMTVSQLRQYNKPYHIKGTFISPQ